MKSMQKVDNRTLNQVWAKPPCGSIQGFTTNDILNIGAYCPRVFWVRSGLIIYLFTTLHVEVKLGIVWIPSKKLD